MLCIKCDKYGPIHLLGPMCVECVVVRERYPTITVVNESEPSKEAPRLGVTYLPSKTDNKRNQTSGPFGNSSKDLALMRDNTNYI